MLLLYLALVKMTAGALGSLLGHYRADAGKNPMRGNKSYLRSVMRWKTKKGNKFKLEIRKFFQHCGTAESCAQQFNDIAGEKKSLNTEIQFHFI